jgi:putative aldouronate transport system substrate-binding protein
MKRFMYSKLVVFLIVLTLIGGALAGCSSGNSNSGSDTTKTNTDSKSNNTGGDQKAEEPLEITMLLSLFEEVPDMNNAFWVEFQKRTNTKLNIEWVPDGDYDTKMELILASGDLPDVMFVRKVNSPTIQSAIANGAFWDMTGFIGDFSNYPNLKANSSPLAYNHLTQNGKIVGIPRNRPTVDQGIMIRTDWLDDLGMDIPQTMDEYGDYLVSAAKEDPDGNGANDTIGYVHPGGTGIPTNIAAAFGALEPQYDSEGGLIHTNLSPGYTKTVEWMQDVYSRGGLAQEFATLKTTQAQELLESGKAASYQRNIWRAWSFEQNIKKVNPDAELQNIAPTGPDGHAAIRNSPGIFGALFISKKVEEDKVKAILDFFEATNTPEFFDFIFYGIEGVHHNVVDGNKVMTEQGNVEVGTSAQQPIPLYFNNWWKAYDKAAPKAYNDAVWEQVNDWDQRGYFDPAEIIVSDVWTNTWPNYQNEWESKVVETIVGQMTIDEYKQYVDGLNNKPEFKQAYQEFKVYYDNFQ